MGFTALRTLVQVGCADHLATGPLTVSDLAARCGARPGELTRLLAWAASAGLVRQPAPGRYELADAPASMRPAVLSTGDPAAWGAMTSLEHTVRCGQPAFEAEHGCGFYDYLAAHPAAGQAFAAFMASRSSRLATAIAALDFTASRVVADIGGGYGIILASVLAAWPHLNGILADRPDVLEAARGWLARAGSAPAPRWWPATTLTPGRSRPPTPTCWPASCTTMTTPTPGLSSMRLWLLPRPGPGS
jgi:hypothetical protein